MRIVQTLIGILLVAFILLGSAGLRVFKHSCEEDGIFTSYILPADDHCQEKELEELPPCCQKESVQVSCCDVDVSEEDDCCSDEVDIYTVDFDFFQDNDLNVPHFTFEKILPLFKVLEKQHISLSKGSDFLRPPPDPLSGREILIKNQVFRI